MERFRVSVGRAGPYAVITVIGDLDVTTTGLLRARVAEAFEISHHLVFDLAGMLFMDSAGIRVLLDAFQRVRANRGSIALCAPRPSPRRVMELTGLAEHIPIHETMDEALASGPAR